MAAVAPGRSHSISSASISARVSIAWCSRSRPAAARSSTTSTWPDAVTAPTRYQFLRDRRSWEASLVALEPDADGNLHLAALPGPADGVGVTMPGPYAPAASGIVAGPCGAVFVADTEGNRVLFLDGLCNAQAELRGFAAPRGLAIGDEA